MILEKLNESNSSFDSSLLKDFKKEDKVLNKTLLEYKEEEKNDKSS